MEIWSAYVSLFVLGMLLGLLYKVEVLITALCLILAVTLCAGVVGGVASLLLGVGAMVFFQGAYLLGGGIEFVVHNFRRRQKAPL